MGIRIDIVRVLAWSLTGGLAVVLLLSPHFGRCGCRRRANESVAIATLKNLVTAQQQAIAERRRDEDGDGVGEPLLLAELATGAPPLLTAAFANVVRCRVRRAGYWFEVHLPTPQNGWTSDRGAPVDCDLAEGQWRAYAWPATNPNVPEGSIQRAFAVGSDGIVHQYANVDFRYHDEFAPEATDCWRDPQSWTRVD